MKVVVNSELVKSVKDKNDKAQLEYFKKELIKILARKDSEEISKAIEEYDASLKKAYTEIGIEKAGYGIGTVRVWKGQKFRKIAPGKWRRIYDSNTRGANQSIAILRKKIQNAQNIDELLQLVMENTNRFMDAEGKLLPIVDKLNEAVKASKTRLNAGKPSTQEQIEQFKKENGKKDPVFTIDISEVKPGDRVKSGYKFYTVEKKYTEMGTIILETTDGNKLRFYEDSKVKLENPDYETPYSQRMKMIEEDIDAIANSNKTPEEKIKELSEIKDFEALKYRTTINAWDREMGDSWREHREERQFITDTYDRLIYDKLNPLINEFFAQTPEQIEKKRKAQEAKDKKNNDLKNKIEEANKIVKSYTDDEIQAAFSGIEEVLKGYNERKNKYKTLVDAKKETKSKMAEMYAKIREDHGVDYIPMSTLKKEHPEYKELDDKEDELNTKAYMAWQELREYSHNLDKHLGPVAYYYLNKFEYEKDNRIDNCNTTEEVMDLIKEKDWYSQEGNSNLDIKNIDIHAAKDIFKAMERMFAIFPEQKGSKHSINSNYSNSLVWAVGGTYNGITLNRKYWKNYEELIKDYDKNEGGFHPKGTKAIDILFHEYYHVMTTSDDLANTIYKIVSSKLKMRGSKGGAKIKDVIQFGVSEYACKNADEFGAECFCQAMGSEHPTGFAIEVFKQTLKYKKFMRGLV